jgi:crossover junction endodeoxyribonuclease RusA
MTSTPKTAAATVPSTAAAPASAPPRSAAGQPPAAPSRAAGGTNPSRLGRSRGAGAGRISSMEADGAVPGGGSRPGRGEPAFLPPRPGQVATGRTFTITLPAGMKLLSLNGREHWSERARRTEALKTAAWAVAHRANVPMLDRVSVVVEYQPPDRRRRDAENTCAASGKAAIDGLVAAGLLEDDACPRYITEITCRIGELYPKGRLVLHITEVTAATGGDAA